MRSTPLVAILATPLLASALSAQRAASNPNTPATLPVTRVSLYKNGVGFFEHTGHVTGDADVSIDFTTAQLNDVLQSLTAVDLNGGRISGAGYNSTTPLEQQLKSLALGLPAETTYADFLTAIRGAHVSISGQGAPFTGRLMDIEMHNAVTAKDNPQVVEKPFLSVVSDAGELRIFEMSPSLSVHVLDAPLRTDVNKYLQLLESTHNTGLRHLTLNDRGTGTRELHVSYISEVPIWKSTYRILFTDSTNAANHTATLQGWAVVDNTVGEDWTNVLLSLVAGSPQSFIQPLSDPIYSRRPEIPISQEAQLTPQTFDSSVDKLPLNGRSFDALADTAAPAPKMAPGSALRGYGIGSGSGIGPGSGGNIGAGVFNSNAAVTTYQQAAASSLTVNTQTAAFDDFFEYKITQPITIRKNESALVPILQSKIDADRVTLVSYRNGAISQPLRALWIKNTSGLTLDRGSFSLVENGSFGGEGLLEPIHPDERRLLSYAADQAVHIATEGDKTTSRPIQVTASKGVINIHRADTHEVTFVLHNAAADRRTVVTEVPVIAGWELDSDPKPEETTATVYRFRTEVAPGETVRLHVGSKREGTAAYQLTRSNDNQLTFILDAAGHSPLFEQALAPILGSRRRLADAQTAVDQTNAKLTSLRGEEDRQRANITALNTADKGSRDRFVKDLNATEDQIKAAQSELTTRTTALDAAKADLSDRIEQFQINQQL
jgi:hypothetical protein